MAEPLSDIEELALVHVVKHIHITCAVLGFHLWGKPGRGNCSCPWARPAGAVLKKLRARGLVERFRFPRDPRTLYRATQAGKGWPFTEGTKRALVGLPRGASTDATKGG